MRGNSLAAKLYFVNLRGVEGKLRILNISKILSGIFKLKKNSGGIAKVSFFLSIARLSNTSCLFVAYFGSQSKSTLQK
ncbi:hypothetical protein A0128_06925 [Leptospira tipperaryensis]|uniref:Uncharacterized protein n=1 Tax=Leptospira tipperaryensis TaxID=2564040 RepID=A0A1D7UVN8_9LEPT|nr:hypothetical protein A0128_06925 [Leptospira tipperaryensis]